MSIPRDEMDRMYERLPEPGWHWVRLPKDDEATLLIQFPHDWFPALIYLKDGRKLVRLFNWERPTYEEAFRQLQVCEWGPKIADPPPC